MPLALGALVLSAAGCGQFPAEAQGATTPSNVDEPASVIPLIVLPETNRVAVDVAVDDVVDVDGAIDFPGDYLIYELGAVNAGERLIIDLDGMGNGLDGALAVFDSDENAIFINDDASYYGGDYDPHIDFVIPRSVDNCCIGVAASGRADTGGAFKLRVERHAGALPAAPERQVVFIDFRGADAVQIGQRTPVDVPPFDGAMIGPDFADQTDALAAGVVARVRSDFVDFNVEIWSSLDGPPPSTAHTTVYMGSYNDVLLGISDSIDVLNARKEQNALVFVDTFAAFTRLDPTTDEMCQALANVTSHEIGHLLGLHHTHDPSGIMDTSASLRQMLARQSFRRSPLADDAFATGYQDAALRLVEAVGGSAILHQARMLLEAPEDRDPWYDGGDPTPARHDHAFGTGCGRHLPEYTEGE